MDSKEYSWALVTADILLSHGPCELLYALFIPSSAATATADIYDGENTSGKKIIDFRSAQSNPVPFAPPAPVYCEHGLYVDTLANVKSLFIQWREL